MDVTGVLSKYRIIGKLGEGGMGAVYKAEDPALLRTVAIKVMAKQDDATSGGETRFLREARAASAFNHPNIVTIYEIGETDDQAYIVMEYVEGRSLRDLISSEAVKPETVLDIAGQTCDALVEAHSRGIIHRDIKPENILLTERGRVKLVDFGLAKTVAPRPKRGGATAAESLTEAGTVMGTLSYMSPEQLRGGHLDERTDIFSFGIVLYELITCQLPFMGSNSFEVAASILKDPAFEIGTVPAGLPRGIKSVVARLLEKRREDRYSSFAEVKRAIESLRWETQPLPSAPRDSHRTAELPKAASGERSASLAAALRSSAKAALAPTILVLPLQTVGSDESSSYISIGLAHAITTDLAKIKGLSVLSKSAGAGRVDEGGRGARELARELGATILLEGEVMRAGQVIGVMARLTDAETGHVIWGSQYRGDASDLFSIHDTVCESVAQALKLSISTEVRDQIARRRATTNLDAFEFYSKGRAFLERYEVTVNVDFAIQMFDEALKLDQAFALAYAGLGEAYWRKYQDTRDNVWVNPAIAASDRALALDPYQAEVHISLGIIYHGTGKIDRAIEEFKLAVELRPASDDAFRWLGRCYTRKGDPERAIGCFEKAIEIRPGYWDNYNKLGECHYTFGRYREAAEQYRRIIEIQPDNFQGYSNLGSMYYLLGLFEDAAAMYRRAIEINPNEDSHTNLGTTYFYLGRYDAAIESYTAAVGLNPRNDILHCNLGDAYLRVGRKEEAAAEFKSASDLLKEYLTTNPDDAESLSHLAICQAKLQQRQEAQARIEQAIALEPNNTTLMYEQAVVYALTGEVDNAIKCLGDALAHGYSRSEAERDPDLETLRERPEYKSLLIAKS